MQLLGKLFHMEGRSERQIIDVVKPIQIARVIKTNVFSQMGFGSIGIIV